jgi:hypothetical protein
MQESRGSEAGREVEREKVKETGKGITEGVLQVNWAGIHRRRGRVRNGKVRGG